jgi:hypothetical protein
MIRIEFIDRHGKPTNDYVLGWPCIAVDIEVGFDQDAYGPDDQIAPNFVRQRAIVDTGATYPVIDLSLVGNAPPIGRVRALNMAQVDYADTYCALMRIPGLTDKPFLREVGSQPLLEKGLPAAILIGRDILRDFRLIYDSPGGDFRIERH